MNFPMREIFGTSRLGWIAAYDIWCGRTNTQLGYRCDVLNMREIRRARAKARRELRAAMKERGIRAKDLKPLPTAEQIGQTARPPFLED